MNNPSLIKEWDIAHRCRLIELSHRCAFTYTDDDDGASTHRYETSRRIENRWKPQRKLFSLNIMSAPVDPVPLFVVKAQNLQGFRHLREEPFF